MCTLLGERLQKEAYSLLQLRYMKTLLVLALIPLSCNTIIPLAGSAISCLIIYFILGQLCLAVNEIVFKKIKN